VSYPFPFLQPKRNPMTSTSYGAYCCVAVGPYLGDVKDQYLQAPQREAQYRVSM
jgi:hypothetical protein